MILRPATNSTAPITTASTDFPTEDEIVLFERLSLEIMQAGLSWLVVLKKRAAFKAAFAGFDPKKVAKFDEGDIERLLNDEGIVRNRLKVLAIIENARRWLVPVEFHARSPDGSPPITRAARTPGSSCSARPSNSLGRKW